MQDQIRLGCIYRTFKARLIMSSSNKISIFSFFLISSYLFTQTAEDLSYLELLPDSQSQSIAEKLGVQTGKPINDEVIMDSFDDPSFDSMVSKTILSESKPEELISSDQDTLSYFGQNLFKSSASTFAPIDLAPAPLDYILGPGDEIRIQLFGNVTINRAIKVNREGNVIIPELGVIQASGIRFSDFISKVQSTVEASLIGTSVELSLSKIRSIQIFVLGNAFQPGAYTVSSLTNISNVLFFAGGPSLNGSLREIQLKRNGEEIGTFDFYNLLVRGDTSTDLKLISNDVIVINPVGKTISIDGEIKNPAIYELKNEESFLDLIDFSSGFTSKADKTKITLSKIANNGERIYANYSFEQIKDLILDDGDEIFIHSLSNTPRNVIKVVGEISSTGLYAYEEGMTLQDLIKPESILEKTYTPFTIIERENKYGSKTLIKSNLLAFGEQKTQLKPNDIVYVLSLDDVNFLNSISVADALGILSRKDNEKIAKYFSINRKDRYQCNSLKLLAKQSSSSSITFVKSKYLPNPNLNPIDQLEFVGSCPEIYEEKPFLMIFALENSSVISGEVRKPGIYPSYKVTSPTDLLSYAGGQTDKSSNFMDIYTEDGKAVKVEINQELDLVSLGIKGSFYANLSSRIDNQVFSINLSGAFISPGIYGVKQGERLSDVIKRAGGYKRNAYPFGGILARKSVAEKEKLAFLKSADQLEQSIATAISSGRITSVGGDPTLALTSISRLITNLQEIEPIGRVVTEFDLDILERFPEKDLLLEPGDKIFIPERSSTITVSGQVLSPTSFTFDPSLKVSNYISLAGGYSEDADKNRTLLIYPNGQASRVRNWPNSPDIAPGTTLVVPRDPNPFDWLVFSQVLFPIISNFATSAAAIAALGNNN